MKLKGTFTLTGLAGEYVAVPLDGTNNFHGMVKLNESGAEVFRAISEGLDTPSIVQLMMEKHSNLDSDTALKAVNIVIHELETAGLLEK